MERAGCTARAFFCTLHVLVLIHRIEMACLPFSQSARSSQIHSDPIRFQGFSASGLVGWIWLDIIGRAGCSEGMGIDWAGALR